MVNILFKYGHVWPISHLFFVCRNRIHISVHLSRNQRVARNVAGNHSSGGEESPLTKRGDDLRGPEKKTGKERR